MTEPETYKPIELKIVQKKSGAYELRGFSIKQLKTLEEWHKKHHPTRKWKLSNDNKTLYLL